MADMKDTLTAGNGPMQLVCEEGVWWFAEARGERAVSVGINHLQPDCWLAPYNREAMLERYGGDLEGSPVRFNRQGQALPRLMDSVKARLREWGFNALGMHTYDVPPEYYADEFHSCVAIEHYPLGSRFRFGEERFPDIFSNEFAEGLEERVEYLSSRYRPYERFLGYAFSDIPRWYFYEGQKLDAEPVHPWVRDLAEMPAGSAGRRFFRQVCGGAQPRTREESDAVLEQVVRYWYELHSRLIRRYHPGALILGDKLHSPHRLPKWLVPILREQVDLLFLQWYCPIEQQEATLRSLHEATGKPMLNGDSCFGCAKPPRQTRVKGYPVESQAAVGTAYASYLKGVMRLPFMLGWHHCGLMEQWDGGKRNDWEINENGLMDPFERPYEEIVGAVRRANRQAAGWHGQAGQRPCPAKRE